MKILLFIIFLFSGCHLHFNAYSQRFTKYPYFKREAWDRNDIKSHLIRKIKEYHKEFQQRDSFLSCIYTFDKEGREIEFKFDQGTTYKSNWENGLVTKTFEIESYHNDTSSIGDIYYNFPKVTIYYIRGENNKNKTVYFYNDDSILVKSLRYNGFDTITVSGIDSYAMIDQATRRSYYSDKGAAFEFHFEEKWMDENNVILSNYSHDTCTRIDKIRYANAPSKFQKQLIEVTDINGEANIIYYIYEGTALVEKRCLGVDGISYQTFYSYEFYD
jgi:hypothetical protein